MVLTLVGLLSGVMSVSATHPKPTGHGGSVRGESTGFGRWPLGPTATQTGRMADLRVCVLYILYSTRDLELGKSCREIMYSGTSALGRSLCLPQRATDTQLT